MVILEPKEHYFSTLVGLELQKQLLKKMWHSNMLPQTLLFEGPPLIGKRSLAYALCKFVNCETGRAENQRCACRTCDLISRGLHPDVFLVEPQGASRTIQIDQLRDIQDKSYTHPIEAKKKVVIFVDADRMNLSAANSALKLLEEPPSFLLLILLSSQPHQIIPTVRSRCTRIPLNPVHEEAIEKWLQEKLDTSESMAQLAASFAAGIPGLALELVRRNYLGRRDMLIREFDILLDKGFPALFSVADELTKRFEPSEIVELFLSWFRDILVAQFCSQSSECLINKDAENDIYSLGEHYTISAVFDSLHQLIESRAYTQRIVNKRLLAMVLFLRLGKLLKG